MQALKTRMKPIEINEGTAEYRMSKDGIAWLNLL
jgi:hypothetical protein